LCSKAARRRSAASVAVLVVLGLWTLLAPLRAAGLTLKLASALDAAADPEASQPGSTVPTDRKGSVPLQLAVELGTAVSSEMKEQLLMVDINDEQLNETTLFLSGANGELYASEEDLRRWRLLLPKARSLLHDGRPYYRLHAIPGLKYRVNEATQAVSIVAPAQAFELTALFRAPSAPPAPVTPRPGGFVNYDLVATHLPGAIAQRSAQVEIGAFGPAGVVTNDFIAQHGTAGNHFTRLDTTWTEDRPDELASLRIGDATSSVGQWGQSVHFGGIQYATNFSTQPNLITFPLLNMSGQAALPSTINVYVNGSRVSSQKAPPGPFTVNNIPVVTGSGEVTMVVRDALGREQVVTSPFYASPTMLRKGLQDFSYEAGFVRDNYALSSTDYGPGFASGTFRLGLTDRLTGEWHAEVTPDQVTAGVGAAVLPGSLGVVSGAVAASSGSAGQGALVVLGAQHLGAPWSVTAHTQFTTSDFRDIGLPAGTLPPSQISNLNLGYVIAPETNVGLSYVYLANRDAPADKIVSASLSRGLGRFGQLGISATDSIEGGGGSSVFVTWTIPLDDRMTASLTRSSQSGNGQWSAMLQKALPAGDGYGYKLQTTDDGQQAGELDMQNRVGTYSVQVAQQHGQTSEQLSASGGVAVLGGGLHFARTLSQSFGLVQVPGYSGVRVYADNQLVGRTDENGEAMIPMLRPYQENKIGIEQLDLPLDAKFNTLTEIAVPYYRSGVLVKFPVHPAHGALFTILLEDGKPLPTGATVRVDGGKEEFPVGLQGEVYVTGLGPTNKVQASWHGQTCEFEVRYPKTTDPLPRLGTFTCKGVQP
jgi:outer membrane usher protein